MDHGEGFCFVLDVGIEVGCRVMTLKRRYYALIKVLMDNRVRIEWMRSTRDKNWKWCFGDGDLEIRGIARQGRADLYIHRKQKTRPRIDIPGKGQGGSKKSPLTRRCQPLSDRSWFPRTGA